MVGLCFNGRLSGHHIYDHILWRNARHIHFFSYRLRFGLEVNVRIRIWSSLLSPILNEFIGFRAVHPTLNVRKPSTPMQTMGLCWCSGWCLRENLECSPLLQPGVEAESKQFPTVIDLPRPPGYSMGISYEATQQIFSPRVQSDIWICIVLYFCLNILEHLGKTSN